MYKILQDEPLLARKPGQFAYKNRRMTYYTGTLRGLTGTMKSTHSLSILGGKPAFDEPVHVGSPNTGNRQRLLELINDAFDRRRLTNHGPLVEELEERIAARHRIEHCVITCNGTIALQMAIRAAGLTGEVIVPAFTFVATAHALTWQKITPVFCDIDPETHNLDPACVEALITPRTSGVLGVHCWGRPCNVQALESIARHHGLALLFDAASCLGCSHRGSMIGRNGMAEILSLHVTKCVHSGEGGAILTKDSELAAQLRLMRNFGFDGYDHVASLGINGKMNEISAAVGLVGLDRVEEIIDTNRCNYLAYRDVFRGLPGLKMLRYDESEHNNYHYIVLEIGQDCALDRDELVAVLFAEGVLARRYFFPGCHRLEPYKSSLDCRHQKLRRTEDLTHRVLVLPTGCTVDEQVVGAIGNIIREAIGNAHAVRRRIAECRVTAN